MTEGTYSNPTPESIAQEVAGDAELKDQMAQEAAQEEAQDFAQEVVTQMIEAAEDAEEAAQPITARDYRRLARKTSRRAFGLMQGVPGLSSAQKLAQMIEAQDLLTEAAQQMQTAILIAGAVEGEVTQEGNVEMIPEETA